MKDESLSGVFPQMDVSCEVYDYKNTDKSLLWYDA